MVSFIRFTFSIILLTTQIAIGQLHDLTTSVWKAQWIAVPDEPVNDYGVYFFRKTLTLPAKPAASIVHVSADNRYKLFVNGKLVSLGPARCDFFHWNYETVDIAPFLQAGKNVVAAQVWNEGSQRPLAQMSYRTGFILQGQSDQEDIFNTDTSWKCMRDSSNSLLPARGIPGYYAAGPGEQVDMRKYLTTWKDSDVDDTRWKNAYTFSPGVPKGVFSFYYSWMLVPSSLPAMELLKQPLAKVVKVSGADVPIKPLSATNVLWKIKPHTTATLLLDQSVLTNAYPTLIMSDGKDAAVTIQYAEALYAADKTKGNRNVVEGKTMIGLKDKVISDGRKKQIFTTRWWRTYRYVELTIVTQDQPLIINEVYGTYTGYPFQQKAAWQSTDPSLGKIFDIGWRTARLCAMETYMDCPYYEQLQYIGDTRIQALVSLYNSGDDRLVRNALNQMDQSRLAEGITASRYPSYIEQQIPTFSLWYIGMLHDYRKYRQAEDFVRDKLSGTRDVLEFFHRYQQPDGSLKNVPYWTFTDWCEAEGWNAGMAPIDAAGNSAALDLQLLWAYQLAAELEHDLGMESYSTEYKIRADQLARTIRQKYWDDASGIFADTKDHTVFSQHTNALAILTHVVDGTEAKALAPKLMNTKKMAPASIYFRYYVHQAMIKAGYGNEYLQWLGIWHENIAMGLTTWGEDSDVGGTRSDCHAWGASPNIEFLRTVLGIDSDSPGFTRVKIEPHVGTLKKISGSMPHPAGEIAVRYEETKGSWNIQINLPETLTGTFIWKEKRYPLPSGKTTLKL